MTDSEQELPLVGPQQPQQAPQPRRRSLWTRIKQYFHILKEYRTSKEVRILDRRLGYVYYICLVLILLYVVIYVFIINKAYLDVQKATGYVYVTLQGEAISTQQANYVWDVIQQNPWGQQTAQVFIPSKVIVTEKQQQGICGDPYLYCQTDQDCSPIDIPNVVESPYCLDTYQQGVKGCGSWKWCPPQNEVNSTVYYLEGASQQVVWARYKIAFSRLSDQQFENFGNDEPQMYPGVDSDAWQVNDLTLLAGSNFSDIVEKGALLQAIIYVDCLSNFGIKCDTHLEVKRSDDIQGSGYSISHGNYFREGDILYRDLYHMKGVRVIFSVIGVYTAPSLYNIVLQLASALGLLIATSAITDAIMLNILKEKTHFRKLKIFESPDLND